METPAGGGADFMLSLPADRPDYTGSGALSLVLDERPGHVVAQIVATEYRQIDELLFELYYDASQFTPLVAQSTEAVAAQSQSLNLKILDKPGLVAFGQVPVGISGKLVGAGTVLAEVLFSREPFPAQTARVTASVPVHTYALSPFTWDADNARFKWFYANPGDFDQNGMVGISDIVPLGRTIGTAGPFSFDNALSMNDNDRDGQITLADLAAISFYYGNFVEAYNFYTSSDIEDVPGGYAEVSSLSPLATLYLSEALGNTILERRWLTYQPATVNTTSFYWVRPAVFNNNGGVQEGTRSNLSVPLQVEEGGGTIYNGDGFNLPPTATMALQYTGTDAPLAVTLDASLSEDPDGRIISYEWDFDGDGLFDTYGPGPLATHVFNQPGVYEPLVRVTDNSGAWTVFRAGPLEVTEAPLINQLPVADLIATELAGEVPLTVGLLANGSYDPDGYIVQYEWDLDSDGAFEHNSGSDSTLFHVYETAGSYVVRVRVTDDYGDQAKTSVVITAGAPPAPNQPPIARLTPDVTAGNTPLPVNFDASASEDPDGSIVKYYWDLDGNGVYETITFTPYAGYTYTTAGIKDVRLTVEDDHGTYHTAQVQVSVNVVANEPPVADLVPSTTAGLTPLTVGFDATGSVDPDGAIVRYDYDFNGDGIWDAYDASDTASWTYTTAGNFDVRLRVTDSAGAQDDALATIIVNLPGNLPPVADLQALPGTGLTPLTVVFDASLSLDPDGSIVRYDYDFDGNGIWDAYDAPNLVNWTYYSAGTYNALVRVTDDLGAQHTAPATVTATAPVNSLPLAFLSGAPIAGLAPLEVSFDASASVDLDGTIIRYDYDLNGDGIWDAYDGLDTVSWTYTTAGAFGATVRVTDNQGGQDTHGITITVNVIGNNPPIANLLADTTTGNTPLLVNFDASGSTDPEGPIARYDWDFNGDGNYEYYDGSPTTNWTYAASGTYDATVRVTDGLGAQDTMAVMISVNVPGNTPPTADITATPDNGNVPLSVTLDASGSFDPDPGDAIQSYEWDFNGDGAYETVTYTPVYIYTYTAGGVFNATLRVQDIHGVAGTDSVTVTVIVPGNNAPNASLSATPSSGDIPLAVTLDASSSSDPDPGDAIATYEWDFDGDSVYDALTFTPTYLYTYTTGGTFDPVVRVRDTNGATDTATAGISANVPGNTPPTAALTATPDTGNAPLAVTLDASGSFDPDVGDSITSYEWDFDGDGIYDALSIANNYLYNYVTGGTFETKVRVTDTNGVSDIATATVTVNVVGNNPPTAALVATPDSGSIPLEVTLDASGSFDADPGDSIASYEWDFNGDGNYDALTYTPTFIYTYMTGGSFDAKVRVKDIYGATDTAIDTVDVFSGGNNAPVADLDGTPDSGALPLVVILDASASADPDSGDYIASYEWDFEGDGFYDVVTFTPFIIHSYNLGGSYTATVRVRDSRNATDVATKVINAGAGGNADPTAALTASPTLGYLPLQVHLDASGSIDTDGTIVLYEWDFNGDGTYDGYGASASADHTYYNAGVYGATVRVTDDAGATDTASAIVSVLGSGWSMFGHDMLHSHRSPVSGPQTTNIKWQYLTGATINGSPAIGPDGTIYVGSLDNYLYAINPSGTLKWRYPTGNQVRSTPCVGPDGTIYFGSFDNNLYALNSDGSLKWFFPTGNSIAASPVLGLNGTVYVGGYDNFFYAINPDGTQKWSYAAPASITSSAAVGPDGRIYVGMGIYLYSVNPANGSYYWRYNTGAVVNSSPAVSPGGTIYIGSDIGRIFAVNHDGTLYWNAPLGGIVSSSPAIGSDGTIYVGSASNRLYAFAANGTPLWNYDSGSDITSSPVVDVDGTVYFGCQAGIMFALNPNGSLFWTIGGMGSMVAASPAIGPDGTLYIGTYDDNLYAFGP